ncbi:MAG TPA: putative zinc-binding metallopeptidase, partial [Opitutus sp.]|nr:putative zinc-binding metallopeptidase [Opitutus sp.]
EPAPEEDGGTTLRFRFMGDAADGTAVLTGHADGVITINLAEADDDVREQRRVSLHEPFRTLLGHFRHEVAHYYWDRLVARTAWIVRFRELFGDERADYGEALQRHYRDGPPAEWATRHVSAYASMHAWEDWAETAAHYFHIIDTIETAAGFGMSLRPRHPAAPTMTADPAAAVESPHGFDASLAAWFPLTYALNALNRGVGLPDLYPFVLAEPAIAKLRFVHEVLTGPPPRAGE